MSGQNNQITFYQTIVKSDIDQPGATIFYQNCRSEPMNRPVFLMGLLVLCGVAEAHSKSYDCKVDQIAQLGSDGLMRDVSNTANNQESLVARLHKYLLGQTFVVNRSTGTITQTGSNTITVSLLNTSKDEEITIISDGRNMSKFKVIYVGHPPTSTTTFLLVNELEQGETKPFLLVDTFFSLVLSGKCR